MRRPILALMCSVTLVACGGSGSAADRAHAIEGQVWSPYCPGRLLIDCTTPQARELRGEIAERVEAGDDTGEVIAWVRSEFGDQAIARPEASGAGLVVWLVPALIFLIGTALVLRKLTRSQPQEERRAAHRCDAQRNKEERRAAHEVRRPAE